METIKPRDPEVSGCWPTWCHHHCTKMHMHLLDPVRKQVIIAGSAAQVTIQKAALIIPSADGWFVDWEVVHVTPYSVRAQGRAHFSDYDLRAAFGLSDVAAHYGGQWLIDAYGGDVASQGKYIRWREYLNIPCPGTCHDGDPNVSIYIDEEIRRAVRMLLE